ncbi:DUF2613 family protein [Kineosporia mesophila]
MAAATASVVLGIVAGAKACLGATDLTKSDRLPLEVELPAGV